MTAMQQAKSVITESTNIKLALVVGLVVATWHFARSEMRASTLTEVNIKTLKQDVGEIKSWMESKEEFDGKVRTSLGMIERKLEISGPFSSSPGR